MSGLAGLVGEPESGTGQGEEGLRLSFRRLSVVFAGAMSMGALIVLHFIYFADRIVFLPELNRALFPLLLWLLIVSAYAFHRLNLWGREHRVSRQYEEKMRRILFQTVESLVSVIEARDPYTGGHQRRVASLGRAIAEQMGLPRERVEGVVLAAAVHDVGKAGVPLEILTKPGTLNEEEWEVIRMHPEAGARILKSVDFPMPVPEIVRQHHERLDGSGYGGGLNSEGILLEARILGVADTIEAMLSDRPYRPAPGLERALKEISDNSGTLYDPAVVEACVVLFREKGFSFEEALGPVESKTDAA